MAILQKVFALALLAEYTSANVATPMTKVVELLDNIKKKLESDAEKESQLFSEYTDWCDREKEDAFKTIKKTKAEISDLEALLEAEEAFRKKKGSEIEKLAGEIAKNEKDLKDATVIRERDRKLFLEEERTLIESIDALERSLDVMAKKAPALPQTGSASLAHVATTLRRMAERSPDFALNEAQQSILEEFFQNAMGASKRKLGTSLDFLQFDSYEAEDAPYGDYESKGGGITETLQKILEKTKNEKDEQAKKEQDAQFNYKKLAMSLKIEIDDGNKALTEKKRQVAKSEQVSAEKTAELAAAKELLQVTEKHLEDVKAECVQKAIAWHARTAKRSDEITAIQLALQIMTSAAAQKMRSKQTMGSLPPEFLQTKQTTMRAKRAISRLRASGIPSVSLLALRAHHRLTTASSADPFADVKKMIQDMLVKLTEEMAEEAKKKEFCDNEMSKSTKSKHQKEKEVDKLESKIEQLEADLEEVTNDLETLSKDTAEAAAAVSEATKIRGEEKMTNLAAIKEYQDAQTLLNNALNVLKEVYAKDSFVQTRSDAAPPDTGGFDEEHEESGGGSGVLGIIEIAIADFNHLEEDTTSAENSAAHEYKKFMQETQIQQAVWAKDLEYKNKFKIETDGDLQRAKTDLEGYQKELAAVNQYIEKLKPQCFTQPDSYEERKKRRDAELKSLQEALAILTGEGI